MVIPKCHSSLKEHKSHSLLKEHLKISDTTGGGAENIQDTCIISAFLKHVIEHS